MSDTENPVTPAPASEEKATVPNVEPVSTSGVPSDERLLAAVGYIPMLFVAPLIMKPGSKFCQMHAKQSLVITGITFFVLFILVLIPAIGSLLFLALIGLIAIGAFQANNGVEWEVPFLYKISSKLNVEKLFAGTTVKPADTKEEMPTAPTQAPETPSTPSSETPPDSPETPAEGGK